MKEIILPRKKKRSFFTWHVYATLTIILAILLSGSLAWYMNRIIEEGTAIERDGYHTAEEWRELISD